MTKKPTAAQIAARKKFAAMAKSGELAKKRKAAAKKGLKKPATKTTLKKPKCGELSSIQKLLRKNALNECGRLNPGWYFASCGTLKFKKPAVKKK